MEISRTLDAVLWNGQQLTEVPEWISKALQNFDYKGAGWIMRINELEESVIHVGTTTGMKIAKPGDYITHDEHSNLDVITAKEYARDYHTQST